MKRLIDDHLTRWADQEGFKPLLLRGARQVGKTYAVRQLGKRFTTFIELNFEFDPKHGELFEKDLDPHRIVRDIQLLIGKKVVPEKTLLFFDEIQMQPKALQSLRYFYELLPDLHVIAAGSLIEFAIEHVGMPVGRVQSMYMYPLSFFEFVDALNEQPLIALLTEWNKHEPFPDVAHTKLLTLLAEYLAIGGMPEVVRAWVQHKDPQGCFALQQTLVAAYRQDFGKYAKKNQMKYVDLLFDTIPLQLGQKYKYSVVEGDYRKRELAPCLDLLVKAGVVHKVYHTAAQGLPLGAQVELSFFKTVFLDVALAQTILGLDVAQWFLQPEQQFINKGELIESFVGQELLAYAQPTEQKQLYYWQRMERGSQAEIDYVAQIKNDVIPIEVKSGRGTTLKSMHLFLEKHTHSPYGLKFSTQNFSVFESVRSYPLYAIKNALE